MSEPTPYDAVPYATGAYPQTHPDRLATIATLLGLAPAPPDRCRVLEVGCGTGGNLIPMAFTLPDSRFVGIDLAARPVAHGSALIEQLGLKNITLLQQDLASLPAEFGTFDMILAHGIYAWVPPPVQDRLLALCRAHLAPQGVAFVSYNAYPGSHLREMVREMMQFHVRSIEDPAARVEQAKGLLDFLRRSWPKPADVRYWVGRQAEAALTRERDTLFHDELAADYRPAYFHQFMAHAARHDLQFLSEAEVHEMNERLLPKDSADAVAALGSDDLLRKEQYMDFLKCRSFRQTLLCRKEASIRREIDPSLLERFLVETRTAPVPQGTDPRTLREFRTPKGATMATEDPLILGLMRRLEQARPRPVPYADLWEGRGGAAERAALVMQMVASGILDLRLTLPPLTAEAGERPRVSRLARRQLERGDILTNLLHRDVTPTDARMRRLLQLLDGTRDRAELLRELGPDVTAGALEYTLKELARLALFSA